MYLIRYSTIAHVTQVKHHKIAYRLKCDYVTKVQPSYVIPKAAIIKRMGKTLLNSVTAHYGSISDLKKITGRKGEWRIYGSVAGGKTSSLR